MAFCANCGNEISEQAVMCPRCGHPSGGQTMVAAPPRNGLATASMVTGIVSIPGSLLGPLGGVVALTAVGLGIAGLLKAKRSGGLGKGKAIAGLILGAVGVALNVALLVIFWEDFVAGFNGEY